MSYGIENKTYLGGYIDTINLWGDQGTWGPEIWNKMIRDFNIESIIDIGCGLGFSTNYFSNKGLYAIGVEGGENAIKRNVFKGSIIKNDYTKSSALNDAKIQNFGQLRWI